MLKANLNIVSFSTLIEDCTEKFVKQLKEEGKTILEIRNNPETSTKTIIYRLG